MESIITVVGFLGAGKTTLLRTLVDKYTENDWSPFVILNDYENALLDAQQFEKSLAIDNIRPLNGSCICCSGIGELRNFVNRIPKRPNGVTLIEANGTSDACSLMGFLGVGIDERFAPPIQISVVDAKNWQKRGENNELEANQIQVSSLIVLSHVEEVDEERLAFVKGAIKDLNPSAEIIRFEDVNAELLPKLSPSTATPEKLDHLKAHWSSCSIDLPELPSKEVMRTICQSIPESIVRVKGVTTVENEEGYTYFERLPDGTVNVRDYNGTPVTGSKLIAIGPGSSPELLQEIVTQHTRKKIEV